MNNVNEWFQYRMLGKQKPIDIYKNLPENSGVYEIANDLNQIIYVGKSDVSIRARIRDHLYGRKNPKKKGFCIWNKGGVKIRILEVPSPITSHLEEITICMACEKYGNPKCNIRLPKWCKCK